MALLVLLPTFVSAEYRVYFGNLHSHSNLSDGNTDTGPARAFELARDVGRMDFLSLSEHNHMVTPSGFELLKQEAASHTTNGFVALFGQEFSTINTGFNHTNVQNYDVVIPGSENGKYKHVFGTLIPEWLSAGPGRVVIGEFNHPEKIAIDYGFTADFGGNWDAFVATMDPVVKLIAVSNGPADANKKSFVPDEADRFMHREISTGRWFEYLSHGMHLAPKIDHDTHSPTHGFRIDGRTAVWVDGPFTQQSLLDALSKRHCYATEDRNLSIVPKVNGTHLPGDRLGDVAQLDVSLSISDADEPDAQYTARIYQGFTNDTAAPSEVPGTRKERTGDGSVTLLLTAVPTVRSYYVVKVEQRSAHPPCGKADDAYLAPIWVSDQLQDDAIVDSYAFVGSRNSKVYHYPNCADALRIRPANIVHYSESPAGMRLHKNCPREP